ncbi:MAG: phage protease [Candidatus Accumulibacter sp.]|uniref:phage protease n=1 Tax=Accumulibacter sp. TaxID=2053492 RepID=UPI001A622D1F|nr:phage protease [Accumulibacter sp.]MBL8396171.1 phage protease [Accumulibacter sp.]
MIPAGTFRAVDGRPENLPGWYLDRTLAAPICARAHARRSDYVIDYEHQTLLASQNGKPAPAAGWYRTLEWRDGDGLYATDVRWTPAAAKMIADEEYRYLSPVFGFDDQTGAVRSLACAALVSNPGLDGLTDLGASLERLAAGLIAHEDHPPMEELIERLRYLLNLPITTTAEEIVTHLEKLIAQIVAVSPEVGAAASLDLAGYLSRQHEQLVALQTQVRALPDPAEFVPVMQLKEVQDELARHLQAQLKGSIERLIEQGLAQHKLLPAQIEWARELGSINIALLARHLDTTVPIAALGGTQTGGEAPGGAAADLDRTDAQALANAALAWQAAQAAAGISVPIYAAVKHVATPV